MFNRKRIKELESRISILEHDVQNARDRAWSAYNDVQRLAEHLGVGFVNIEAKRVVQTQK